LISVLLFKLIPKLKNASLNLYLEMSNLATDMENSFGTPGYESKMGFGIGSMSTLQLSPFSIESFYTPFYYIFLPLSGIKASL